MEPIIVNSQIDLKQLYNINWFILLRKRVIWVLGFVCLVMLYSLIFIPNPDGETPWFTIVLVVYFLLIPLLILLGVRRNYKKIPSMSEPKEYGFFDDEVQVKGITVSATMAWSVVERVYERNNDFLTITSNGKGVHFLPMTGFKSDDDIYRFKTLIKAKGIKNNIK